MSSVLVVEDYPNLRQIYETVLAKHGFEVTTAADGKQALEIAKKKEFDLIVLDMLMPNMDGMDFLRAYDKFNQHPKTKIVAFSNMFTVKTATEAKSLGADRYYTKAGFDASNLMNMINDVMA